MPRCKRINKWSRRRTACPQTVHPLIQEGDEYPRSHLGQGTSKITEAYKQQLPEKDAQEMNIKTATRADERALLNAIESANLDQAIKLLGGRLFSQDRLDIALMSACRQGLKCLVQTLVRLGANVNFKDTQGNTPLLICADNGFAEIIRFLVDRKADVNVFNSVGDSALILAIRASGSSVMVTVLLGQEGIDITHQNLDGYTALMKAVEFRDVDAIKILMDGYSNMRWCGVYRDVSEPWWKESMQTVSSKGMTAEEMADKCGIGNVYHIVETHIRERVSPLLTAIEKCDTESLNMLLDCHFIGNSDICVAFKQIFQKCQSNTVKTFTNSEIMMIRRLLECGADSTITLNYYTSPLSVAVETGDCNLVELLCQRLDEQREIRSWHGLKALREAAKTGRCDLLKILLKYKIDINGSEYSGSPLDYALSHGHLESAKLLAQHGAKINIKSALQSAVTQRVPDYLNFILNYFKSEVVTYAKEDFVSFCSLLVPASKGGSLEIIGYLLDAGADVNASRESPLAESKNGDVARFLITRGAIVNLLMADGDTPLLNILNNRHEYVSSDMEVVKVLLENGASVSVRGRKGRTPIMLAASIGGSGAMLQILLDHGADVNEQDEEGNTVLIAAVKGGCSQNVSFLLQLYKEKNHCVNVQNHKGLTALMCAVPDRDLKIAKELLEFNADVNIKDKSGYTALLHAVEKPKGSGETITALIRAGSDVNWQNNKGYSPLMLAAKNCSREAMLILLYSGADVNAVRCMKKDIAKTALTFLSPDFPFPVAKNIKSCIHALLSRGAYSSYANPSLLYKIIFEGELNLIPELIRCGLGPTDFRPQRLFRTFKYIKGISTISPLYMALLVGNVSLARYFVRNLFLTSSDVTSLVGNQKLRLSLERMGHQDCLDFLNEMSSQPLSLYQLTFVTVLSAVGTYPGRENRVNLLPLPQVMKDKLLFKSEEVQLIPTNDFELDPEMRMCDLFEVSTDSDDSDSYGQIEFYNDDIGIE